MDSLFSSILESLLRGEAPPLRSLEIAGEQDPSAASMAFLRASSLEELAASRASWVPALMVSARPGLGATRLHELALAYTKQTGESLDPGRMPALALVLGSSERMGQLLIDNPEWADDLVGDPPAPPDLCGSAASFCAIRESQSRGMLSAVARELIGCPLETTFAELTGLAEACLETALECASAETGVTAPAMFALGQFGGGELGLSPAVDLLFVDPPGGSNAGRDERACEDSRTRKRLAQIEILLTHLQRGLGAASAEGVSYQLDYSQRPTGIVSIGVASTIAYFTGAASTGERRLVERIRPLQADPVLAKELVRGLAQPSGEAKLQSVVDNELKYRAERRAGKSENDLIQGVGGVCDLEAIVHVHWAAATDRRCDGDEQTLLAALYELGTTGAMKADASARLSDAYSWLRRAEHSMQLVNADPSQCFPRDPQGQIVLARCMGYREPDANRARERLLTDRQEIQQEVQDQFENCVLGRDR